MHITKSAPLPERPCEQLTCCEKIGSVQGNYINCVKKRHNCRITGKEKATCHGGQCDQCGGLLVGYSRSLSLSGRDFHVYTPILGRLYVLMNCSIRNVFTSRSLRFSAISCFIFWINHSSGSGMVYSLLTEMRRSSSRHGADSFYPLGSMPRRFSSALANSLNQLPRVRPSEVAASFTCWRSSLLILIWKVGDHPSPRGDLSRFNVDMYVRNSYYHCCYVRTISVGTVKSKAPQVSLPLAGLLTNNVNEEPLWLP